MTTQPMTTQRTVCGDGWVRIEFKGRTERWCHAETRTVFGINMVHCEQPFPSGSRFEFFNADGIFRVTFHSEERVRSELERLELKWKAKEEEL